MQRCFVSKKGYEVLALGLASAKVIARDAMHLSYAEAETLREYFDQTIAFMVCGSTPPIIPQPIVSVT